MTSEHYQASAPPPIPRARMQSPRLKFHHGGGGALSARVPVALDDFAYLVVEGGAPGLGEFFSKSIEDITNQVHQKQQQQQQQQQPQHHLLFNQQIQPHPSIKSSLQPQFLSLSPRRSPVRVQRNQLSSPAKIQLHSSLSHADNASVLCTLCEAAQHDAETKQRRERSHIAATNPITGNELSPGGALPMRAPVAMCGHCKGGVCEAHLLLHSVKAAGHWDSMKFYDSVVDAAYRSLPPQAQLLSRVMLRCFSTSAVASPQFITFYPCYSIDTIRKRAAEEKADGMGYSSITLPTLAVVVHVNFNIFN